MHLLFKQRGAGRENDNCFGLKLAKNTCVTPGAALRRVYDRAQYTTQPYQEIKRIHLIFQGLSKLFSVNVQDLQFNSHCREIMRRIKGTFTQ